MLVIDTTKPRNLDIRQNNEPVKSISELHDLFNIISVIKPRATFYCGFTTVYNMNVTCFGPYELLSRSILKNLEV